MRSIFFLIIIFTISTLSEAKDLHVGVGYTYPTIASAAAVAQPGDSIICHDPVLSGGIFLQNLKGTEDKWIYLIGATDQNHILRGGSNSIQFSNAAYLHIEGFIIEGQTGNGMNIDDGGNLNSPTHHITITRCTFRDINATGNNDLLKLSGLDDFEISHCQFINGSNGGSGIDMVGCHHGKIVDNTFENQGSNSIQAKGGTSDIDINRNHFKNGGARALNLGGSTGLAFFRPQNATTEAENIRVIANVIQGSEAPIAFVGCRKVQVSNNTIIFPKKWAIRILQETVDENRFLPCGDNRLFNNLFIIDQNVNTEVNIGPNTAPATFSFENNLWWKTSNSNWQGPNLPGTNSGQILSDPMIIPGTIYRLGLSSPAIGKGLPYSTSIYDIENNIFNNPPSVGAYEPKIVGNADLKLTDEVIIYPNPAANVLHIEYEHFSQKEISLYSMSGIMMYCGVNNSDTYMLDISEIPVGLYLLKIRCLQNKYIIDKKVIISR